MKRLHYLLFVLEIKWRIWRLQRTVARVNKLPAHERNRIVTKWIWDLSHLPADTSPETLELAERCLEGLTGRL